MTTQSSNNDQQGAPSADLYQLINEGLDAADAGDVVLAEDALAEMRRRRTVKRLGAAKGKLLSPADLDRGNDEIAALFGIDSEQVGMGAGSEEQK